MLSITVLPSEGGYLVEDTILVLAGRFRSSVDARRIAFDVADHPERADVLLEYTDGVYDLRTPVEFKPADPPPTGSVASDLFGLPPTPTPTPARDEPPLIRREPAPAHDADVPRRANRRGKVRTLSLDLDFGHIGVSMAGLQVGREPDPADVAERADAVAGLGLSEADRLAVSEYLDGGGGALPDGVARRVRRIGYRRVASAMGVGPAS